MKAQLLIMLLSFGFYACGSGGGGGGSAPTPGPNNGPSGGNEPGETNGDSREQDDFDKFQSASHPQNTAGLVAAFGLEDADEAGFVAFYDNNVYFAGAVYKISSTSVRMYGQVGYYAVNRGETVFDPKRTTCRKIGSKVPQKTIGTPASRQIVLNDPGQSMILPKINVSGSNSKGLVVTWGCLSGNGSFTPESWSEL